MKHSSRSKEKATIHDVAAAAGTSISTVSRVLTGSANVRPAKHEAVLQAIEELGYSPNLFARGLKTNMTYYLGLVINDIQSPFQSTAAKGMQAFAISKGYATMLFESGEDSEKERQYLEILKAKGVDGIVFVPTGGNRAFIQDLVEEGIPLVQIDRSLDDISASVVVVDDEALAYVAVNHLIENGYQRVAILIFDQPITPHCLRLEGYRRALSEANLPAPEEYVCRSGSSSEDGYAMTLTLLDLPNRPEALVATSSRLGIGALKALKERNLRVGDDVGVIVFDDIEAFPVMTPSITAVHHPGYDIGWKAAELVVDAIESGRPLKPQKVVLPAQLIIRESSQPRVNRLISIGHEYTWDVDRDGLSRPIHFVPQDK